MPKISDLPGLKRLPKPDGHFTWYWSVSQILRDNAGFKPRTVRLWHGRGEPTAAQLDEIKGKVHRLLLDLEEWRQRDARANVCPARLINRSPRGYIYFIRCVDRVKIGFSKNVGRRMADLQVMTAEPLELLLEIPGSLLNEQRLHRLFGELRISGEWFRYEAPIAAFIEQTRELLKEEQVRTALGGFFRIVRIAPDNKRAESCN